MMGLTIGHLTITTPTAYAQSIDQDAVQPKRDYTVPLRELLRGQELQIMKNASGYSVQKIASSATQSRD